MSTFLGVAEIVDLVVDWRATGPQNILKKCEHSASDLPFQRSLLDVCVAISGSRAMNKLLEEMKTLRMRLLQDTYETPVLRSAFLKTVGAACRM